MELQLRLVRLVGPCHHHRLLADASILMPVNLSFLLYLAPLLRLLASRCLRRLLSLQLLQVGLEVLLAHLTVPRRSQATH